VAFVGLPDGRDLSRELVRSGAAWHYVRYSQDPELGKLEAAARSARTGFWADPLPEPPAVYRAARRGRSAQRNHGQRRSEWRSERLKVR
jgi:micrococcal nuclease